MDTGAGGLIHRIYKESGMTEGLAMHTYNILYNEIVPLQILYIREIVNAPQASTIKFIAVQVRPNIRKF